MSTSDQYISLARKYRPKFFADLIGQEFLVKVLNYSIQNNQLAHSFLFTGIRGVGKTTSARIVAHTLNCTDQITTASFIQPCQKCPNCLAFQSQSHPDIVEIDAASYTSVENIREVIEKALYVPVLGKYKVFIIDEVHMLSKSAFNALLKTLEEPPGHVIFILLTTELNKVPITILSRCQKFNLARLGINELVSLLESICNKENIKYEKAALENIAYKADGSARDATILLEQALFLAKQQSSGLSFEIVRDSLDLNNFKYAIDFISYIFNKDASSAINLINKLYRENFDFISIAQSIIELLALLSKLKLLPNYNLGHYASYSSDISILLNLCDLAFLTALWQIFNKGVQDLIISLNQLIGFEMLIIKAIYCKIIPTLEEVAVSMNEVPSAQNNTSRPQVIKPAQPIVAEPINSDPEPKIEHEVVNKKDLFDFLKFVHKQHMFETYHFIMNECEIKEFRNAILKIHVSKNNDKIKSELKSALSSWRADNWQITFNIKDKIYCLQALLLDEAENDKNFKLTASFFPESKISDVWFNFLME